MGKRYISRLWKDTYSFPNLKYRLELHAQSTPERAECRDQDRPAVLRVDGDVALGEEVVAIGYCFPVSRREFRQCLPNTHVKEWIHLIERFAIGIQPGNNVACDPLVTDI